MDTKDKKSPKEAAVVFNSIIAASVKGNPKPPKKAIIKSSKDKAQ